MSSSPEIVSVANVTFRYGDVVALDDLSFAVGEGQLFGLLGPNGSGKSTLFKLLSTLFPVKQGEIKIGGYDLRIAPDDVRRMIGVTFQSPSLDTKLTVKENLIHQGRLYGLLGTVLSARIDEVTEELGLSDRLKQMAGELSGGLKRRLEIAKALLHRPRLLLLDEPSTGLDVAARLDLWNYLQRLRDRHGITVLATTHLMDEAERCDRLVLLDRGKLVAEGTASDLRASVGKARLTVKARDPALLGERMQTQLGLEPQRVAGQLFLDLEQQSDVMTKLTAEFGEEIEHLTWGRPTLEDVFLKKTGHHFHADETELPHSSEELAT